MFIKRLFVLYSVMVRGSKRIHGKFSLIDLAGAWNCSSAI